MLTFGTLVCINLCIYESGLKNSTKIRTQTKTSVSVMFSYFSHWYSVESNGVRNSDCLKYENISNLNFVKCMLFIRMSCSGKSCLEQLVILLDGYRWPTHEFEPNWRSVAAIAFNRILLAFMYWRMRIWGRDFCLKLKFCYTNRPLKDENGVKIWIGRQL